MDVVKEALGWRVMKVVQLSPTSFEAFAHYSASRRYIPGVVPPFQYSAKAGNAEAARAAVLALCKADKQWPLMLDTEMPGVHDWRLHKDGKRMGCRKCQQEMKADVILEACSG